ncbi:unnamed protein product [Symbiodinium sp. CCMP2592]|nr:unnamed protein product [Symbiodinium sp. CCMP2592]
MAMLFAVSALLAASLGIAQGSDASQCAASHRAMSGSLLQHASQSSSNPFASKQHAGCRKMIHHCLCKDCEDEAQEFYHANWSAWKLGFDMCCNSQYNEVLCGELAATMFDFSTHSFGPGDHVKDTPDPALEEFCHEAEGLMDTHFAEQSFQNDTAAPQSAELLETLSGTGFLRKLLSKVGLLNLRKLLYRSKQATRSAVILRHVENCHSRRSCWEHIGPRLRSFFLKQAIQAARSSGSRFGKCFWQGSSVSTYKKEGSNLVAGKRKVEYLLHGLSLWSRGDSESWKLSRTQVTEPQAESSDLEGTYCKAIKDLEQDVYKVYFSGREEPLHMAEEAVVFIKDAQGSISRRPVENLVVGMEVLALDLQNNSEKAVTGIFVEKKEQISKDDMPDDFTFCGPTVRSDGGFFVNGINVDCDTVSAANMLPLHLLSLVAVVVFKLST